MKRLIRCRVIVIVCQYVGAIGLLSNLAQAQPFSFQPLLPPPATATSAAYGISANGSVIVGSAGGQAVRWTTAGGTTAANFSPVITGEANAISSDGTTIVGDSSQAFRWTSGGGTQSLGVVLGNPDSYATAASANGSVIVGATGLASQRGIDPNARAFRSTSGGTVGLGVLPGAVDSYAFGVSADGSKVVGESGQKAFTWTQGTGLVQLPGLPGVQPTGAEAISADGSTIVGFSNDEVVRWVGGNLISMGDLGGQSAVAYAVSANGSVIVGSQGNSHSSDQALLWTAGAGLVDLKTYLIQHGVLGLTGWQLESAQGISDDGRTIVGYGLNPSGTMEAFVATVPEPSSIVLGLIAMVALAATVVRRRRARATR